MPATPTAAPPTQPRRRPAPFRSARALGLTVTLALGTLGALGALDERETAALNARQRVVEVVNARRAEHGLDPVRANRRLMSAARVHSADQAAMQRMTHTGSDGSNVGQRLSRAGYDWSNWAENVAAGYPSARSVVRGWMGSTAHRANVLAADVRHIGVARAYASDGTPYWTMVLARPD